MRLLRMACLTAVAAGVGLGATGCGGPDGPPAFTGPPARVVCTTTLVADVVGRVGGDRVAVQTLMGPGVDPHRYLPTAGDKARLEAAHLVVFNGLHLEGKMTDTFEKAGGRMRAVAVTRTVDPARLRPADVDGSGEHDPHVWFDVVGALDAEVRTALAAVPKERRVLVTSHDAFGYFGRAYGFEVIGLQGVSTASETGVKNRAELAATLGKRKIPAVFTESSVPKDGLEAVLETCAKDWGHAVSLVGGDNALFSDALGEPGTPAGTYPGMVRHNVRVIVEALTR